MSDITTLGELRRSEFSEERCRNRSVKDEMRENLVRKLRKGEDLFPGVHGYEESVIPQIVNAILSRHNIILLGLRGQAKSRILRALTGLLDERMPVVAGCEINDNPYAPICRACRDLVAEKGDETPVAFVGRDARYVEKLATPDVTIADIIGDVDPIKAARGGHQLSDELTIHYGLLPRSNRGIFAVNELPDLAGKIQVGLFNIMQEGDVQIKGYPVRLPLDVCLVFSANPEDYTARGKIVTPLKDRIGSEISTHYPRTVEEGVKITEQEAWIARNGDVEVRVPGFMRELVEQIAFAAREDQRVDKRSGVSQRLPISVLENVASSAEQRALVLGEPVAVPRVADVYRAIPAITGKLELEYDGEQQGADNVARDVIKHAVGLVFDRTLDHVETKPIIAWFNNGKSIRTTENEAVADLWREFKRVPGLVDAALSSGVVDPEDEASVVALAELLLEGLYARRLISRDEKFEYTRAKGERERRGGGGLPRGWSESGGIN
jgi:magnesium chelatase subunit I